MPYTLPSRSKSQLREPKLVKEYAFANATNGTGNKERKHNNMYGVVAPFGMLRHHTWNVISKAKSEI
ncbi:hypothetical protein P700755_000876 [Psychroflexus torquis ATCC 700755]|uniref:Uncharacterized protein n=1 Tax=Psychroflexus torquis (strain ATCC 700755 / CIP 106069 / ACAM 623) TaxID=313595 RepID=K4IQU3_PSYTT|nr:hypothetical protein P700755_000876 [Psychroflexus torquis ATCC 700755]